MSTLDVLSEERALSAPFLHLLSLVKANSYSLHILLDKASAPTALLAAHMVSLVFSDKLKTSATAARDSPTHHICSSDFFLETRGKISGLHMHSVSYWPLSPPYFYLAVQQPGSLSPPLPSDSLYSQLQLGSPPL